VNLLQRLNRRNGLTIVLSIADVITLVRVTSRARSSTASIFPELAVGVHSELLTAAGVDGPMVAIVLKTGCAACNASAAFYGELARQTARVGKSLVVLSDEPTDVVKAWARDNRIDGATVARAKNLKALGFVLVPTVVLVDNEGVVTDLMLEKLGEEEQAAVIARVAGGKRALDNRVALESLDANQLEVEMAGNARPRLIDVSARDFGIAPLPLALRIPLDELPVRASQELSGERGIVIDCRDQRYGRCRPAAQILNKLGFSKIRLLR
jgi:hypothetical protein